jgi:thioester reductase-like protein
VIELIAASAKAVSNPTQAISYFVTGATGFLGIFIVQQLLLKGDITVRALVRGVKTADEAIARLKVNFTLT